MSKWTPIAPWRPIPGVGQNLTIGGASVASTAFDPNSEGYQAVFVSATGNCHIAVGTAPAATGTDMLIKASDPPLLVRVGKGDKIAVIQDGAATGTLNIVPATH
jgi:hypothetical protein